MLAKSILARAASPVGVTVLFVALAPFRGLAQDCEFGMFWGRCREFPSHEIAEEHYYAAKETIKQFLPKLDSCLNELAQVKNDQDKEPVPTPSAAPVSASGCQEVLQVTDGKRFIYKQSAPLRQAAAGSPITGFREEPTLIMNENISSRGTIPILDSAGKEIVKCPWASASGHAGGRARCSAKTADVRRKAIANTGSPTILFKINPTQCVSVPDAGRCYGSVKGLCDRLIQ